jgi:hypothetical protein
MEARDVVYPILPKQTADQRTVKKKEQKEKKE